MGLIDKEQKIIWFETDVRTRGDERIRPLLTGGSWQQPRKIARAAQAVLAFSDDFYSYRKYNKYTVGIEIRDGKIMFYGAWDGSVLAGCCSVTVGFSTFLNIKE